VSLNVSSNRLDSLDAASVRWLKHTAAVTDLSGNPWKCEGSALGEVWQELSYKMTLMCASREHRGGSTWDVIRTSCPESIMVVEPKGSDKPNMLSDANPTVTTDTDISFIILLICGLLFNICIVASYFYVQKEVAKRKEVARLGILVNIFWLIWLLKQ